MIPKEHHHRFKYINVKIFVLIVILMTFYFFLLNYKNFPLLEKTLLFTWWMMFIVVTRSIMWLIFINILRIWNNKIVDWEDFLLNWIIFFIAILSWFWFNYLKLYWLFVIDWLLIATTLIYHYVTVIWHIKKWTINGTNLNNTVNQIQPQVQEQPQGEIVTQVQWWEDWIVPPEDRLFWDNEWANTSTYFNFIDDLKEKFNWLNYVYASKWYESWEYNYDYSTDIDEKSLKQCFEILTN